MIATATSPKPSPTVTRMMVTPSQAARWLDNDNNRNRPVSDAVVQRYARDMKAGQWRLTHQGIAFDPQGVLLDGQHRLWAVVEADRAVEMHVWFNVPADGLMVIDGNRPRSLADHLRLGGGMGEVTKDQLAVLRAMLGRGRTFSLTSDEARTALLRHLQAVRFALANLPAGSGRGIAAADCRAVIARAWYSNDQTQLARFCEVLRTSMAREDRDRGIILLRNLLAPGVDRDPIRRRERYAKIERALMAFLTGEPLSRLHAAAGELFLLPDEGAAAGKSREVA